MWHSSQDEIYHRLQSSETNFVSLHIWEDMCFWWTKHNRTDRLNCTYISRSPPDKFHNTSIIKLVISMSVLGLHLWNCQWLSDSVRTRKQMYKVAHNKKNHYWTVWDTAGGRNQERPISVLKKGLAQWNIACPLTWQRQFLCVQPYPSGVNYAQCQMDLFANSHYIFSSWM